jgi:hypothetical protein
MSLAFESLAPAARPSGAVAAKTPAAQDAGAAAARRRQLLWRSIRSAAPSRRSRRRGATGGGRICEPKHGPDAIHMRGEKARRAALLPTGAKNISKHGERLHHPPGRTIASASPSPRPPPMGS